MTWPTHIVAAGGIVLINVGIFNIAHISQNLNFNYYQLDLFNFKAKIKF